MASGHVGSPALATMQREGERQTDVLGDVEHRLQHGLVAAGRNVGHELQQSAAAVDDAAGDLLDLLAGGVVARDRRTALGLVDRQPRRRETESADLDGLLGQLTHLRQVLGGGRLAVDPALPHHVDPQRRVRQIRGDVDIAFARVQRVHVLGEGFPGPRQSVGHHDTGNVLDAGHHVDEDVVVFFAARREADPAVAHHHRGDPVRRRRRQALRPDGLAVVVGVQVDEARGDQQPGGVDLALGGIAVHVSHRRDDAVAHSDVADVGLTPQPVDDGAIADEEVVGHLNNLRPERCVMPGSSRDRPHRNQLRRQGRVRAKAAEFYDTVLGALGRPGCRVAAWALALARISPGLLRGLRPRPRRQQRRSGLHHARA